MDIMKLKNGLTAGLVAWAQSEYPPDADPLVAASGNVANGAAAATLAAVAGRTNWLTGFMITGSGATAASVIQVTVTGLLGGTLTFIMAIPAGVTAGVTPLVITFAKPLPASAANQAIVVTAPAFGAGNTNAAAVATGFRTTT